MTKEQELELLFEKLNALKSMTNEAREYYKEEIEKIVARIKELQA